MRSWFVVPTRTIMQRRWKNSTKLYCISVYLWEVVSFTPWFPPKKNKKTSFLPVSQQKKPGDFPWFSGDLWHLLSSEDTSPLQEEGLDARPILSVGVKVGGRWEGASWGDVLHLPSVMMFDFLYISTHEPKYMYLILVGMCMVTYFWGNFSSMCRWWPKRFLIHWAISKQVPCQ